MCCGVQSPGQLNNLMESAAVKAALEVAAHRNGLLAAICGGPEVLGKYGYLSGKNACCYPGCEENCPGARISYEPIVRDGNVITSRGAGTATEFALELVAFLCSKEKADEIAAQIQKI